MALHVISLHLAPQSVDIRHDCVHEPSFLRGMPQYSRFPGESPMPDEQHPVRIGTPRAQHPATWIGPRLPRSRRFAPTLPPDWEPRLKATLAGTAYPARWLDVLAVILRSQAPDWMIELIGRLPEVDYAGPDAIVDRCRPVVREQQLTL
jgi:hypothetical protein